MFRLWVTVVVPIFFVECPATSVPGDSIIPCPSGWHILGDKCFKVFPDAVPWQKAKEQCSLMDGHLASVHSEKEHIFFTIFMLLQITKSAWIGLHDRQNETVYTWDDGSLFNFNAWHTGEPSGPKDEKEDCTEMIVSPDRIGKWNDINCDDSLPYICQKPTDKRISGQNAKYCSRFDGGGYRFFGSCFHVIENETKTWEQAEDYCKTKLGGHLATIRYFGIQMYLDFVLTEWHNATSMWIGIKAPAEGPVLWSSGWIVTYRKWLSPEYEKHFYEGMCSIRLNTGEWDIRSCNDKHSFICEISNETAPALLNSAEDGTICPPNEPDWRDLGYEYCYMFFREAQVTWPEGQFKCMQKGGTLATIYSEDQLPFIRQFMYRAFIWFHIGLYRKSGGALTWVDGSVEKFDLFRSGEPNSVNEECVEMGSEDMRGNDIGCADKRAYACSVRKVPADNSSYLLINEDVTCTNLSINTVVGVVICCFLILLLICIFVYYLRPWERGYSHIRKLSTDLLQQSSRSHPSEIIIQDYEN